MKVLITGASSGIGRDFARLLVNKTDELILVARDEAKLKKVKEELNKRTNSKVITIRMDLSNNVNCQKLYEEHPDVDLLINNAGFGDCGYFDKTDLDKDIDMINTNIVALHTLTKLYLKSMKKKNKGHILNVASIAAYLPGPLMATYYSTKSYVLRLSESIREELKKEGSNVKISVLCPGPVQTNFEKVANVKFETSKASSSKVASYTLKHLNKFYICPGFSTKFVRIISKITPRNLQAKFVYKVQKKRI